jgi:hypothetical protein
MWLMTFMLGSLHFTINNCFPISIQPIEGARGSAVGWQFGRSRVRFPMVSLVTYSFRPHCGPGDDSASKIWVPGILPGGKSGRLVRLTTLPTSMCRLSWNLGASTTWNPQGLSRPVMGLLYFYLFYNRYNILNYKSWQIIHVVRN